MNHFAPNARVPPLIQINRGGPATAEGLGQKRRFERRPIVSGLPPTPDILSARRNVSNKAISGSWPTHSITSSAWASSDGGTVNPSAFAVLRLIARWYFVGACTGRLAGFPCTTARAIARREL